MFTVSYSASNADRSASVAFDQGNMTDVVSMIESGFGIKLDAATMIQLLTGASIQSGELDIWLTEDVFNGTL